MGLSRNSLSGEEGLEAKITGLWGLGFPTLPKKRQYCTSSLWTISTRFFMLIVLKITLA
jgi:hypothetical protein